MLQHLFERCPISAMLSSSLLALLVLYVLHVENRAAPVSVSKLESSASCVKAAVLPLAAAGRVISYQAWLDANSNCDPGHEATVSEQLKALSR